MITFSLCFRYVASLLLSSLAHATEVAQTINHDRRGRTDFRVFFYDSMKQRRSAIYYLLGSGFENRVSYAQRFLEMPSFLKAKPELEFADLLDCLGESVEGEDQVPKKWVFDYEIPLSTEGEAYCRGCKLFRLQKSPVS